MTATTILIVTALIELVLYAYGTRHGSKLRGPEDTEITLQ